MLKIGFFKNMSLKILNNSLNNSYFYRITFLWYFRREESTKWDNNWSAVGDALYNLELREWHPIYDISYKFVRYTAVLYPNYNDEKRADWLFVLYTLNFPLWYPKKDITQWKIGQFIGFYALHQSRWCEYFNSKQYL